MFFIIENTTFFHAVEWGIKETVDKLNLNKKLVPIGLRVVPQISLCCFKLKTVLHVSFSVRFRKGLLLLEAVDICWLLSCWDLVLDLAPKEKIQYRRIRWSRWPRNVPSTPDELYRKLHNVVDKRLSVEKLWKLTPPKSVKFWKLKLGS